MLTQTLRELIAALNKSKHTNLSLVENEMKTKTVISPSVSMSSPSSAVALPCCQCQGRTSTLLWQQERRRQ